MNICVECALVDVLQISTYSSAMQKYTHTLIIMEINENENKLYIYI